MALKKKTRTNKNTHSTFILRGWNENFIRLDHAPGVNLQFQLIRYEMYWLLSSVFVHPPISPFDYLVIIWYEKLASHNFDKFWQVFVSTDETMQVKTSRPTVSHNLSSSFSSTTIFDHFLCTALFIHLFSFSLF